MSFIFAAAMLAVTPTQAQVSVATGNWDNIPLATKRGNKAFSAFAMTKVDAALTSQCRQRERRNQQFDFTVPFLIEFAPDKSVRRVVIQKMDCPQAEALIGGAVLELAKTGEYQPTGENQTNWYRGEFGLTSR